MTPEEREEQEREERELQTLAGAGEAQDLLEKPLLKKAFAYLKRRYTDNILKADSRNTEAIDENHRMYKALCQIEMELQIVVQSGKIVEKQREQREYQAAVLKEEEE